MSPLVLLILLALVLNLWSISSDKWSVLDITDETKSLNTLKYVNVNDIQVNLGLWNICGQVNGGITQGFTVDGYGKVCINLSGSLLNIPIIPKNILYVCRILSIISVLLLILGLVFAMLNNHIVTLVFLLLSGLSSLITCILWYSKLTTFQDATNITRKFNVGYGFINNLINSIFTMCIGVFFIYYKN